MRCLPNTLKIKKKEKERKEQGKGKRKQQATAVCDNVQGEVTLCTGGTFFWKNTWLSPRSLFNRTSVTHVTHKSGDILWYKTKCNIFISRFTVCSQPDRTDAGGRRIKGRGIRLVRISRDRRFRSGICRAASDWQQTSDNYQRETG